MRLNHLNLCAGDVAGLSRVFTRHFAFTVEQQTADYAMLRGDDGFILVITAMSEDSPRRYPASRLGDLRIGVHVGFMLDAAEAVRAKHEELAAAGLKPEPVKSFEAAGARWTAFYCPVGDGLDIEVNARA